ncbi:protein of unknown function [Mariniphaga anaerophila]|uniref:Lipocalin-like domain-containing protein n=1 Tax=Mariniphaga anaerophila TaxID=1484053 RepID=A0A1M4XJC4_9BACT|nr:DUF5004 domain-containing protein [Mariniphaga anaerophila]SHE93757.1 protein of unknown function [Mariniphaga anaerophila]
MKKLIIYIPILLFILSCADDIPEIGERVNRKEQIVGTWQLEKFIQTDLKAKANAYPDFATQKDLTYIFENSPYTDFSITFNADGTFSTDTGNSFVDMIEDGNWSFNSEEAPSEILLSNGSENQIIVIGSFANIIYDKIEFKVVKADAISQKEKINYTYYLSKI